MLRLGPGDGTAEPLAAPHRDLFPVIPDRARFNRRRRHLMLARNEVRRLLLARLDLAADHHCVIDSLLVPVMRFHLAPSSRATSR